MKTELSAADLEKVAREARRRADIAKHTPIPLADLDAYGDEQCRKSGHAQINLMNLGFELQNAYAVELRALWDAIKTLRDEALYWRQKYEDTEKKL